MKIDITQILIVFDELLPDTDEHRGFYRFKEKRSDGASTVLTILIPENFARVCVYAKNELIKLVDLSLDNCSEVNVLDTEKKCLEFLQMNNSSERCFLSLLGESVLDYSN